jgi:hypothetical protein
MSAFNSNIQPIQSMQMGRYLVPYVLSQTIVGLSVLSIVVIDSTHLQVVFSAVAKNNTALITTGNYIISPNLTIHSVTPDSSFSFVTLLVDEMLQGRNYTLEIQNVEPA